MAQKNRVRFDKWVWDNLPPFFFIFIVVLAVFIIVGLVTRAISIGAELPAGQSGGGAPIPLVILLAWFFLFAASIMISLWKGGRDKDGTGRPSGLNFPGGGASSQW
jgi:uncharacterized membrane protein YgcG